MTDGNGATPSFHVPGLVPTGPSIVTSRFDVDDGYTYDGYVRTGGYVALRKANNATPGASIRLNTLDENDSVNTDWQKLLFQNGYVTNQDLGITGGSERGNYSVGFNVSHGAICFIYRRFPGIIGTPGC